MSADDKIILTYGDSVLRESDVELLRGPSWLNDTIISFHFEYLSNVTYHKNSSEVLFIGPEVTHCLKATESASELSLFLGPLNAKEKSIVFFAFNDSRIYEKSGGTHWSLLVYSRLDKTMFHLDSMCGNNYRQAAQISGKIIQYLSPSGFGDIEELVCLQQDNGYDCGIFVLCHAELVMNYYLTSKDSISKCGKLSREVVSSKRQDILDVIFKLKNG